MRRSILLAILLAGLAPTAPAQVTTVQTTRAFNAARLLPERRESLERILLEGNAAFLERRFDDAIKLYEQGIAQAPLLPAFWTNKAITFYVRAIADYNRHHPTPDTPERTARLAAARRDVGQAVDAAARSLALLGDAPGPDAAPEEKWRYEEERARALSARAESLRAYVTMFDARRAPEAVATYREFVEAVADPALKTQARFHYARLLFDTGAGAAALDEFRELLAADPNNLEALLGVGLALTNVGHAADDQARSQEGLEHLRWFVERVPDTHPLKSSAGEALAYLDQDRPAHSAGRGNFLGWEPRAARQTLSEEVINGKAVYKPAPRYPPIGVAARVSGPVYVEIVVDEQGSVVSARAASGHPLLRAVAAAAAREAKFTVTTLGGRPVKVGGVITYNFVLQDPGGLPGGK